MVENETVEMIEEVVEEPVVEEVVEEPVVEEVVEEVIEEIPEPEFCVVTCERLNIREAPNAKAAVLCVVTEGEELMIAPDESTDDWYGVYTKAGVEGFCMKKFTALKK